MKLSIIITHHNTPELLDLCLKSIKETIKNVKYEIIVVDSELKEKTKELIQEKHPKIRHIFFKKNVGYSKIVNAGLKEAKGDYILILNADIIVLENAVSKMLRYMKDHIQVGILGPKLLDFTHGVQSSCFSFPTLGTILARRTFLGRTKWGKKKINRFLMKDKISLRPMQDSQKAINVDWLQGSAIMVRKEVIERVGLLDERFFAYFEDTDWCWRFWQSGYEVAYLPYVAMVHYYHRSSKKWGPILDVFFNKRTRIHLISALKYFWKYRTTHNIKHET